MDSNGAVTLLESVAVRLSSPLLHMGDIKEVAWSSSGLLASGSADGMLAIHTYKQGNITNSMPLPGHTSQISAITWGPNGKELATSADQDIVIVWDLDSDQTGAREGLYVLVVQAVMRPARLVGAGATAPGLWPPE